MEMKFIKLTVGKNNTEEYMVNPLFITSIRKMNNNSTIVYMMNDHSIHCNETTEEVIKKIKDTEKFIVT